MDDDTGRAGTVVCGVDGSTGSRHALVEAARTAIRRGDRLRVMAVYEPPETRSAWGYGPGSAIPVPDQAAIQEAEDSAARAMVSDVLVALGPELGTAPDIIVQAVSGRAVDILCEAAREADELVVGHRGRGAVGSLMLGSVGLGCVLHAACPVTVVPEPAPAAAA